MSNVRGIPALTQPSANNKTPLFAPLYKSKTDLSIRPDVAKLNADKSLGLYQSSFSRLDHSLEYLIEYPTGTGST